ncbi:MAG: MCE family protein [Candidatus Aminicenantes bacterium]|nr:MCE family protein [Candidatus Aminicenantes bacterium]
MMTHEQKVRLGVFLVLATIVFLAAAGFFIVPMLREAGDLYTIDFYDTSVHGLVIGSPAKYRGVEIGKVVRVEVSPENFDSVRVTIKVQKGMPIKTDMTAVLAYVGLTGQKYVEISGGTPEAESLRPHAEIPMGRGLGEKAEDIVTNLEVAAKRINELLAPENLENIRNMLANAEKGSASLASVLEARRESLSNALASFERTSVEMARVAETLGPVSEDLGHLVRNFDSGTQAALGNISQRFSSEELGAVIQDVGSFLDTASVSLKKVESVLLGQQAELNRTFSALSIAVENLALFSREISEDPSALLRTRKDKKK